MNKLLKQLLYINMALFLAVLLVVPAIAEEAEEIFYTLRLHQNDGSNVTKSETNLPGASYTLADYLFRRDSYVQVAWAETPDGEPRQRLNALYVPATSTDLYAFWLEVEVDDINSGVVILNGLQGDLDEGGTFYQKMVGSVTLPVELCNSDLLAWSTDLQPVTDEQGVLSGQWYVGGEVVTPKIDEILTLYGQPKEEGSYVIYRSNGRNVVGGGSAIVQAAKGGNLEGVVQATTIGEEYFEVLDNDSLIGWSETKDALFPDYWVGEEIPFAEKQTQVLYAIWHHIPTFTNYVSNNDATCLEDGTMTAICDDGCGMQETIPDRNSALGHSYTTYIYNNDATCEDNGTKTAVCDNGCGIEDLVVVEGSALGHKYDEYISNNDATCETDGTKTAVCVNGCGNKDRIIDEGSALGHIYTAYTPNNDATCEADGTKTAVCANGCGSQHTVIDSGSARGHVMGVWVQTKAASCTENGEEKQMCASCEYVIVREIIAGGHLDSDMDYCCDLCNAQLCTEHTYSDVTGYRWFTEGCKAIQFCNRCGGGKKEIDVVFELSENELTMSHVPLDTLILVAAYEDGQLNGTVFAEAAERICYELVGSEVRVYFLEKDTYCPLMDRISISILHAAE